MTKTPSLERVIKENEGIVGMGSFLSKLKKVALVPLVAVGLYGGNAQSMEYRDGHAHSPSPVERESYEQAKRAETLEYWLEKARDGYVSVLNEYSHYVKGKRILSEDTKLVAKVLSTESTLPETYLALCNLIPDKDSRDYWLRQSDSKARDSKLNLSEIEKKIRDSAGAVLSPSQSIDYACLVYSIFKAIPKSHEELAYRLILGSCYNSNNRLFGGIGALRLLLKEGGLSPNASQFLELDKDKRADAWQSGKVWISPVAVAKANPEE